MRPQNLREFAEDLRRRGDIRESDLADEILTLVDLEEEIAEPYSEICADLETYAPKDMGENWPRMVEWLGDRSNLLEEIEKQFEEAKRPGDADDVVRELLGTLKAAEAILEEHGWPGTDFLDALEKLAESAPTPMEYDL